MEPDHKSGYSLTRTHAECVGDEAHLNLVWAQTLNLRVYLNLVWAQTLNVGLNPKP